MIFSSFQSLTTIAVFEKKVLQYLIVDFNVYTKFNDNLFGFGRYSSTTCTLIAIDDQITNFLDHKDTCGVSVVTIDLSKAFDKV